MRVFLAGLPGVGKSTVLEALQPPVPVIKFGLLMWDAARANGFEGERDGLRRLPEHELARLRRAASASLPQRFILDGHVIVEEAGVFRDAVPSEIRSPGFFSHVVVLEAEPGEVGSRRLARASRRSGDAQWIAEHQRLQRQAARQLADETGAQLQVFDTTRRSAKEVAALLAVAVGIKQGSL